LTRKKVVVDTDVILDYVMHERSATRKGMPSVLREAMSLYFCYTTVFNAIQLFALCRSKGDLRAIEGALGAMKILGLNGRSAKSVGMLLRGSEIQEAHGFDLLIAGLCVESRLPLLTGRRRRFRSVRSLRVIPARLGRSRGWSGSSTMRRTRYSLPKIAARR
jgi:predicted nucleic acid-binding protein